MHVQHKCGWESDGGEFPEGAGCPKCGKPIMLDELKPVRPVRLGRGGRGVEFPPAPGEELTPVPSIVGGMTEDWLSAMTVPEEAAFISEIAGFEELEALRKLEATGKVRTGVLAAIDAKRAELEETSALAIKDAQAALDTGGKK